MKVYFFKHSNCSHHPFLSLKWWQSSILWSVLCRFHSLYHCSHSLSLIAIRCHLCHSLLLFAACCHLLSLIVTHCHLLSLIVPLVATRCTTLCHSLYHLLSLVIIRCHLLYYSLALVVIRCHSSSLDVPLVCLFINDHICL